MSLNQTNIAVLFKGIGDVSGGGGAERFFADYFQDHRKINSNYKLFFLTDDISIQQYRRIDKLIDKKQVLVFKNVNNRFKNFIEFLSVMYYIRKNKIKLLMIPLYNSFYFPLIKRIDSLPNFLRPKIVPVIVDYNLSYYYFDTNDKLYNFRNTFQDLFEEINIDSIITWYESFVKFAYEKKLLKNNPPVYNVTVRYSTPVKINSYKQKSNQILFVGRLTPTKKPLMFLQAIREIKDELINLNWQVLVVGKGVMEEEVRKFIEENNLQKLVNWTWNSNPKELMAVSKCFVSTQDFENFPSLSMNEALQTGNAVISRNVGQTGLFVKDNVNGLLLSEDNYIGLSKKILEYVVLPEEAKERMYEASIKLTKEIHTFTNFNFQMESFWSKILGNAKG